MLEGVQQREKPPLVDLGQDEVALVGVAEALRPGGAVREPDHLDRARLGMPSDLLARLPEAPGVPGVARFGQRVVQVVLGPLAAIQAGPEAVEQALLLGLQSDQLIAYLR